MNMNVDQNKFKGSTIVPTVLVHGKPVGATVYMCTHSTFIILYELFVQLLDRYYYNGVINYIISAGDFVVCPCRLWYPYGYRLHCFRNVISADQYRGT